MLELGSVQAYMHRALAVCHSYSYSGSGLWPKPDPHPCCIVFKYYTWWNKVELTNSGVVGSRSRLDYGLLSNWPERCVGAEAVHGREQQRLRGRRDQEQRI